MDDSKPQDGFSPDDLRNCSIAVYCGAVERDSADTISRRLRWAADTIEALTEALEQARAQGRQEGFAEARERAALAVYKGIKFYHPDGRHLGTWPPDCTHKEALMSRIRDLQPTSEEGET